MEHRIAKQMNEWRNEAKAFKGFPAMFWAGRLSIMAGAVAQGGIATLSENVLLLDSVRREYDNAIMSEPRLSVELWEAMAQFAEEFNQHTNATPINPDLKPPLAAGSDGAKVAE